MKMNDVVVIGPKMVAILHYRTAWLTGVGQVWRTKCGRNVVSMTDIRGHTSWSVVGDMGLLYEHFGPFGKNIWVKERGVVQPDTMCGGGKLFVEHEGVMKHIGGGVVFKMTFDEWSEDAFKKMIKLDD